MKRKAVSFDKNLKSYITILSKNFLNRKQKVLTTREKVINQVTLMCRNCVHINMASRKLKKK